MEAIQLLSSQTGAAQKIQLLSAFLQPQNLDGQSVVFEEERESAGGQFNLCFDSCLLLFAFLYLSSGFLLFCVVYFVLRIGGVKRDRGSEVALLEVISIFSHFGVCVFFCIFVFLFFYFLFRVVYFVFRIRGVKRDRGSEVAVREVRSTDTNAPHQLHCWPAQKIKSTDPAIKKGA